MKISASACSDKELSDILYGANPPQDLRQQFTDPNTGQYDANAAYQQIQALEETRRPLRTVRRVSSANIFLHWQTTDRKKNIFPCLLQVSYVPKWMVEKDPY